MSQFDFSFKTSRHKTRTVVFDSVISHYALACSSRVRSMESMEGDERVVCEKCPKITNDGTDEVDGVDGVDGVDEVDGVDGEDVGTTGDERKCAKRNRDEFVSISRSSMVCSICMDIMHAPHYLTCDCRKSFCGSCIGRWMSTHGKCPLCNTPPAEGREAPVPCGRQWGELMDSMKRACPVHVDCRYRRGSYDATQHHAATECVYRQTPCPHIGCGQLITQKNMRAHMRHCTLKRCKNFRPPCYGCNVRGSVDFIKHHETHRCVFTEEVLKQIDDLRGVVETNPPFQPLHELDPSSPSSPSPSSPRPSEDVAHDDGNRLSTEMGAAER
jgi:hypothetical protein